MQASFFRRSWETRLFHFPSWHLHVESPFSAQSPKSPSSERQNINDRDQRRYDRATRVQTFGRDNAADYATVAVEMLKGNASPKAGDLYAALDMPFAALIGQLAGAFAQGRAD